MTQLWPNLSVRRGWEAVDFYRAAFGAVEQFRIGGSDDEPSVVAQLAVGEAVFWVSDESPEHGNPAPESVGATTQRLLLVVDDPSAVVQQAVEAGATLVSPVAQEHAWEWGRITDPFGHAWEIGRPLGEWPAT